MSCGLLTGACVAGLSLIWTGAGGAQGGGEAAGWAWRGLLASFYGGIVEEVQSRLLLVSVFVWLLARLHPPARAWTFAMAILLTALLFGAGHLPAAFAAGLPAAPCRSLGSSS